MRITQITQQVSQALRPDYTRGRSTDPAFMFLANVLATVMRKLEREAPHFRGVITELNWFPNKPIIEFDTQRNSDTFRFGIKLDDGVPRAPDTPDNMPDPTVRDHLPGQEIWSVALLRAVKDARASLPMLANIKPASLRRMGPNTILTVPLEGSTEPFLSMSIAVDSEGKTLKLVATIAGPKKPYAPAY